MFYLKNFLSYSFANKINHPNFIGTNYLAYLVTAILGLGVLLKFVSVVKNIKTLKSQRLSFKTKYFREILIVLFILLIIIAGVGFTKSFMISDIALLVASVVLLALLNKYPIDKEHTNLNILLLAWFLIYFVFFSFLSIKLNRYILTTMPAFVYFVIYGLEYIFKVLNNGFEDFGKNKNNGSEPIQKTKKSSFKSKLSYIVPILLIILLIISAVNFTDTVVPKKGAHNRMEVTNFLVQYDPDYSSKEIMADSNRFFSWDLNYKFDSRKGLEDGEFEPDNATYIISNKKLKTKTFHKIFKSGSYTLYERNTPV